MVARCKRRMCRLTTWPPASCVLLPPGTSAGGSGGRKAGLQQEPGQHHAKRLPPPRRRNALAPACMYVSCEPSVGTSRSVRRHAWTCMYVPTEHTADAIHASRTLRPCAACADMKAMRGGQAVPQGRPVLLWCAAQAASCSVSRCPPGTMPWLGRLTHAPCCMFLCLLQCKPPLASCTRQDCQYQLAIALWAAGSLGGCVSDRS